MCLTIPKKVVAEKDGLFIVEAPGGARQKVKSIVPLAIGDWVITQQNIAVDKIAAEHVDEFLNMLDKGGAV